MTAFATPFHPHKTVQSTLLKSVALPVFLMVVLAGCASPKVGTDPVVTGSIRQPVTQDDFQQAAGFWAAEFRAKPKDKATALNYAASLQRLGMANDAAAVLEQAAMTHAGDRDVLAAYGKALAGKGDLQNALQVIRKAQAAGAQDWTLLSAEAAILDQTGNHSAARALYARALETRPNEPALLSNLGMSYVLTGDLKQAEATLRKAMTQPGADSRVRQNLALAVGLQGRFREAEQIASDALSPEQARANIAYLKQMLTQQDSWAALKGGQG